MKKILIGIDPGTKTGMAIKQHGISLVLKTFTFWDAIDAIKAFSPENIRVYIEDPSQNKPVFAHFKIPEVFETVGDKISYIGKIAQNIGSNKRDAQLWFEYCEFKNFDYFNIRPSKKSGTKIPKKYFEKITKYTGQSSEHSRDAAMLVVGRK